MPDPHQGTSAWLCWLFTPALGWCLAAAVFEVSVEAAAPEPSHTTTLCAGPSQQHRQGWSSLWKLSPFASSDTSTVQHTPRASDPTEAGDTLMSLLFSQLKSQISAQANHPKIHLGMGVPQRMWRLQGGRNHLLRRNPHTRKRSIQTLRVATSCRNRSKTS